MKQFILANSVVASGKVTTKGQVIVNNTVGADYMQLVVGNGDTVLPDVFVVYKKDLRWDKTEYAKGSNFEAEVSCSVTSGKYNETHVVITKMGAVFNERNVWTASGHGKTASAVAHSLAYNINMATATHGLVASVAANVVKLTAADGDFTNYKVVAQNTAIDFVTNESEVSDAKVTVVNEGKPGVGDKADILNRMHACIGDKGLGYTHVDAMLNTDNFYLPALADDVEFDIYTLTFYNPRYDHRIDEPLFQKIHVAVPKSADASVLEDAINDVDSSNKEESPEPLEE